MCLVLKVSKSRYYQWIKSKQNPNREALITEIQEVHVQSRGTYGSRRIQNALRAKGKFITRKTAIKYMKLAQVVTRRRKKFVVTTQSKHDRPIAPNLLNRHFNFLKPNECWVSDITYIWTSEGWLYLASMLDLYSRKVVGWSMSDGLDNQLVLEAFRMGRNRRGTAPDIMHSDRGSQYASQDFVKEIGQYPNCKQSMSRKANCWDNAVAESFFATLKLELVHHKKYRTLEEAKVSVFEYMEVFYNKLRLHSYLGYASPDGFEALSAVV